MGRRVRIFLVAAAPVLLAGGAAYLLGGPVEAVLPVTAGVAAAAVLSAPALLEFVDRPLRSLRESAREAAEGEPTGRPLARQPGEAGRLAQAVGDLAARVSEAEDAARQQREFAGLFEHLGEGVAVLDTEGRLIRCNEAFRDWVGRPDLEGARIGTLVRDPEVRGVVERGLEGKTSSRESLRGEQTYLVDARPFRDGALVTIRDVTELRRLEGVRRDFVANLSHELKTPLTSVTGFAEALSEGPVEPDRAREFGERILHNARRMHRLVDDLLDLARVESGAWEPELEVVQVEEEAAAVWRSLPRSLREDRPAPHLERATDAVRADRQALRQILRNLLENAARYSPADDPVEVATHRDGDRIRIEVADRGPGVPLAHRGRIFERFYRVDTGRGRDEGGTGLGLAIAKHLVLAHGGEIGVESELDRGTTVWFILPAA